MNSNMRSNGPLLDESILSLDPDKIFELQNIDQVKELVRKLQHETDRKREELRTLVGERYRDLMEAAETIICMRDTSTEVLSKIQMTQESMSTLSDQLNSFRKKFDHETSVDELFENDEDVANYALAAQIKLLMDIPERIWNAIEAKEFVTATKFYLFARHIHTNLTFHHEENLAVIERQWAAISQFHDIIKTASDAQLSNSSASVEETMEAILSVILLKATSKGIFEEFLHQRQLELMSKLKRPGESAKNHIIYSLSAISSVLCIVHQAFYQGGLQRQIEVISKEKTIQLLNATVESPVMEFLPSIVKDFSLISSNNEGFEDTLEASYIKEHCAKWLDTIHEILTKETSVILSHVHNIIGLSNIRSSVQSHVNKSILISTLNEDTCPQLLGHTINLWEEFYRNLFRDRIEAIIGTHFAGSIYFLQSSLSDLSKIEQELVIDYMMSEVGLSSYPDANVLMSLKSKAVSPSIKAICSQFDELLETIVKDITEYIANGDGNEFILQCVQRCVISNIEEFLEYVTKKQENLSFIGTGRLLQALPELCSALKTCTLAPKLLKQEDINNDYMFSMNKSKASEPEWQSLKTKMETKANEMFKMWIKRVILQLKQDLEQNLRLDEKSNNDHDSLAENDLKMMPAWDTIEISEQGEDEQVIKSKIRVPQHLSLPAYNCMLRFCQICYNIGVHSLPTNIQLELSQSAALTYGQVYREFCTRNSKLTQNVALQLHFDIEFVMQVMVSSERVDITEQCQNVLNSLEDHIDPFDFSVFSPYISSHVKRCILRHQSLISVMIPNDRFALLSSMKASIPSVSKQNNSGLNGHFDHQSEHNVMILAPNCSRFSLLPVTSSHSQRGRDKTSAKTLTASNLHSSKTSITSSTATRKRSKSPVARAANSFFEAMSNSWFGTK